jgi:hypothetical protein
MLRTLSFILFIFSVFVQVQRPKTLHYVRKFDYVLKQDFTGYDSTLLEEIRYDHQGRPVEIKYFQGGVLETSSLTTYNTKDQVVSRVISDTAGLPFRYYAANYDAEGRLITDLAGATLAELKPIRAYVYQGNFLMRIEELDNNPVHYRQWVRDSAGNPIREESYFGEHQPLVLEATYHWDTLMQKWLRTTPKKYRSWSVQVCKDANCQEYMTASTYDQYDGSLKERRDYDQYGFDSRIEMFGYQGKTATLVCQEHDRFRNIIREWKPLDTVAQPREIERREYDAQGHMIHQIEYNTLGQKSRELFWKYDAAGRCIQASIPNYYKRINYTYDTKNRITERQEIFEADHRMAMPPRFDTLRYVYRYDRYDSLATISCIDKGTGNAGNQDTLAARYETEVLGRTTTRLLYDANRQRYDWASLKEYYDGRLMQECLQGGVCRRYRYDDAKRLQEASLYYGMDRTERKIYNYDTKGRLASELTFDYNQNSIRGIDYRYPRPTTCVLTQRAELKHKTEYLITYW